MAVKGEGTESNPWVLTTWEEVLEHTNKSGGNYSVLANDLNLEKVQRFSNWTISGHFDMQGHTIKNVYCNGTLLNSNYTAYISNGKILNVFVDEATGIIQGHVNPNGSANNVNLENVSISVNLDSIQKGSHLPLYRAEFNKCNLWIRCTSGPAFALNERSTFLDTRICIEMLNANGYFPIGKSGLTLEGCSIEGFVRGNVTYADDLTMKNCVWDLDTQAIIHPAEMLMTVKGTGIYNAEKAPNVIFLQATERTTEQILSPDYNNNHGFPVEKVGE